MSKKSTHKSMGRIGDGDRVAESSSGTRKQHPPRDGDYEMAIRLQKMLDDETGHSDHRRHTPKGTDHRQQTHKDISTDSRNPGKSATSNKASSVDPAAPYPKEIQDALHAVQKFVFDVMETTCRKCDSALMRDFDVHRWFKKWTSTKGQPEPSSICSLTCPNKECRALTCLGCGEKPRMGKFTGEIDGFHLDWCCESGRLFALWNFLCEFDNLELAEQERSRRQVQQSSRAPVHGPLSSNKKLNNGTGYNYSSIITATNSKAAEHETKMDASTRQILAFIIELLPHCRDKSKAIPPELNSMIELSLVEDRIAELLRNDSLQDLTTRAGLYFAVFEFFERLGKHPDTSYLIYEERFVKKQSSGLFVISTSKDSKGKGKSQAIHHLNLGHGEDSKTASLWSSMSNLGIQSEGLLKASRAVKSEFRTAAAQDLLEVAERIAKLQLSMRQQSGVDPGLKSDRDMTWKEYNQKYCMTREENVLRYMKEPLATQANHLRHSPANRVKRLVIEASEMKTSLPPNIFVKVDDVRPDVMKCLIVGPEGTPYEGGLFEFDIFCPQDYPQSPPKVWFLTTAGGTIMFNPNLKGDGKICLSLLGTFPGPPESQWQGAKSSILSVLVSIQAMIFCPEPIENAPAWWISHLKDRTGLNSHTLNLVIQAGTMKHAMLDWLRKNDMRKGLWRDVVRTYFEKNSRAVLRVVRMWNSANKNHIGMLGKSGYRPRECETELANALQALTQNQH